jgi:hypothetical protein
MSHLFRLYTDKIREGVMLYSVIEKTGLRLMTILFENIVLSSVCESYYKKKNIQKIFEPVFK